MAWLVDTCVLIDVIEADPRFGLLSARHLQRRLGDGLLVSPVTYVELAPIFDNNHELQEEFLSAAGVRFEEPWTARDTRRAHQAWGTHVRQARRRETARRPVADALIGAMACRFEGIITRNGRDFHAFFPDLRVSDPTAR